MRVHVLKRIDTRAPRKPVVVGMYLNRPAALKAAIKRNRRDRGTPFLYRVDGANVKAGK